MKCDKLKSLKNIECAFNTTSQQEQVIAEDSEGNCYGFDSWEEVYLKDSVDEAIAELKTKLVEQEVENRKLKRSLWLARCYIMTLLQRDFQRLAYQCNNGDYKKNLLNRRNRYYDLYEKCRAKAEEYK